VLRVPRRVLVRDTADAVTCSDGFCFVAFRFRRRRFRYPGGGRAAVDGWVNVVIASPPPGLAGVLKPCTPAAHGVICERMRSIVTCRYARDMHYDPISRWQTPDTGATSMVYSSRSDCAREALLV
jgi:hypothetical protein